MSDQYYDKEDDVVETDETALANWQAAQSQVASFVPEAAEDLNRTEGMLKQLWDDAAKNGNVGSQALIEQLWKIAERSATRIGQQDGVHQLAKVAYEKTKERKQQIQEELDQVQEAIEDIENMGWTDSPLLQGVVEVIQDQLEEQMVEVGFYIEDPGMEAHANGWFDCLVPEAVDALFFALFGDTSKIVPAEWREKLAEFVNEFGEAMTEVRRERRKHFFATLDDAEIVDVDELEDEELFDVDD